MFFGVSPIMIFLIQKPRKALSLHREKLAGELGYKQ